MNFCVTTHLDVMTNHYKLRNINQTDKFDKFYTEKMLLFMKIMINRRTRHLYIKHVFNLQVHNQAISQCSHVRRVAIGFAVAAECKLPDIISS